MSLQSFERETTFGWDKSTNICQLITFDQALDRKLLGYCKKYPDIFKMVSEQVFEDIVEGHEFEFPKRLISIRQPTKRKMTEEQKKTAAERLKKGREKKDAEDKAKAKVENKDKVKDKKETKTKTKSKTNDKDKDKDKQSK